MAGGDNAYNGANYGFDPEYGGFSQVYSSNPAYSSGTGLATDPRTANVLKTTSEKLNTGANVVEVSTPSSQVFESIPEQHFKELNRLRKLVGNKVELTLHAPIIDPTGMTKRGWNPYEREQAERQMLGAVMKAHELNPEGNVVTTFHSSAINVPDDTKLWEDIKTAGGETEKIQVLKDAVVIDEKTGDLSLISGKPSPFMGEQKIDIAKKIKNKNSENWYNNLQHLNYSAEHGVRNVQAALKLIPEESKGAIMGIYKDYAEGKGDKFNEDLQDLEKNNPGVSKVVQETVNALGIGDVQLRDSYYGLREMFDKAHATLEKGTSEQAKEDLKKLEAFRAKIAPKLKDFDNPAKVEELADAIREGVHVLRSIEAPQTLKRYRDFAIEQSSETFSNLALKSFDKFGDTSPIISIENPPAGAPLSRAEDLRELVDRSRDRFAKKAVEQLGLSESEAKNKAKELIGATWDVGHINMIRKFGAGSKELVEETKKISPVVKHVHLSDNFGMEHTELPMGMGNVPHEAIMKDIIKHNEKVKKVVEVGDWYQHFQTTPFGHTLETFNSPIYAMKQQPYWGAASYSTGLGQNPDIHHSMYGAGFSNLPPELGGQMAGRSRVSGTPLD